MSLATNLRMARRKHVKLPLHLIECVTLPRGTDVRQQRFRRLKRLSGMARSSRTAACRANDGRERKRSTLVILRHPRQHVIKSERLEWSEVVTAVVTSDLPPNDFGRPLSSHIH
ncbi:hypothetical protein [Microbacterium forte]